MKKNERKDGNKGCAVPEGGRGATEGSKVSVYPFRSEGLMPRAHERVNRYLPVLVV